MTGFKAHALLGSALAAGALGVASAATAADQQATTVETIIVTANKRAQNLQDVPVSISALGGEVLGKTGSASIATLQQYVPGLNIDSSLGNLSADIFLRGDGTSRLNAGGDPAVAMYEDEVYIGGQAGIQFDLLDVDSIDVLKGPQGTLYGRNAAAGAIAITTKKPSPSFDFTSDTSVGDYNLVMERASVTGPIGGTNDALLYRLSVGYERRDGFTDNLLDGGKPVDNISHLAARGQLAWVGDTFSFRISAEGQMVRDGMVAETIQSAQDTGLLPVPFPLTPPFDCPGLTPYHQCFSDNGYQNQDLFAVTERADWTTAIGVLTSLTGYRHSRFANAQDEDGTAIPFLFTSFYDFGSQFSEELRLADKETPATRIHWVVGAYYLHTRYRENAFLNVAQGAVTEDDFNIFQLNSYAVFGQAAVDITPRLTLTAGGRYTYDSKSDFRVDTVDAFPFYNVAPSGNWHAVNPSVTLSYKLTDDVLAYASYRQGWISGGFQDVFPQSALAATTAFNPETVNAFTAGIKSAWFDHRLTINAEAFRMNYVDLQVQQTELIGAGGFITVTNNAGAAADSGLDLTIEAVPVPHLTLSADMTLQDPVFTNYVSPVGTPAGSAFNYTNNTIEDQSKFSGSFAAQYAFPLPGDSSFTVRAEYTYRSKFFADPVETNAPGTFQPGYGLLNFEATYKPRGGWWSLEFWLRNAANTLHYDDIGVSQQTGGPSQESALVMLSEPRTFGVQLSIDLH